MYYDESEGLLALLESFLTSLTLQKKMSGLTSGGNDKQKSGRMKRTWIHYNLSGFQIKSNRMGRDESPWR